MKKHEFVSRQHIIHSKNVKAYNQKKKREKLSDERTDQQTFET